MDLSMEEMPSSAMMYHSEKDRPMIASSGHTGDISRLAGDLLSEGVIRIEGFLSDIEVRRYRSTCDKASTEFQKRGGAVRKNSIYINNAFNYDRSILDLVSRPILRETIGDAIGDKVALLACSLLNVQQYGGTDTEHVGGTWHTDSRYIQQGRKRIAHGFTYLVFVCLDDWSSNEEACTKYIVASHKFEDRPGRELDESVFDIKRIKGKPGDAFIIDGGTWHKAGDATLLSRWGMVFFYGPWYIKPYFDYWSMFSVQEIRDMSPELLGLMHFTSRPPVNDFERMNTLVSEDYFMEHELVRYSGQVGVRYTGEMQ